jgi:hypothetical protein
MGNLIDAGQAVFDAELLEQGLATGPAALLDTRETSKHLRLASGSSGSSKAAGPVASPSVKQRAKYEKSKRRAMQGKVVTELRSMATGEHGITAMGIGQKWADEVAHCGGRTCRHDACGRPSWQPYSCDFPLCPWYQQARAKKAGEKLGKLWASGIIVDPKFTSFTVPNVDDLGGAWAEIRAALRGLHRRQYMKDRVRGGFRALETTFNEKSGQWHPHAHELLDAGYIEKNPKTDIFRRDGQWVIKQEHPGLARLWTMECQGMRKQDGKRVPRYPLLYRDGINVDCPEDWNYVGIQVADYGAISEIAKYVAKGDEIVSAGPGKIVEYLMARRNKRMLQGFGSMYNVSLLGDEDDEDVYEAPTAPGQCPYSDCPEPNNPIWEFVCSGLPDGWEHERDNRTGRYRLHPEGVDPPNNGPRTQVLDVVA